MADFLFRKVSEEEKEKIREEAKQIMSNFSKKLSKVNKDIPEPLIERDDFEREETNDQVRDEEFRKIVFENAPNKNKDFILAEKRKW